MNKENRQFRQLCRQVLFFKSIYTDWMLMIASAYIYLNVNKIVAVINFVLFFAMYRIEIKYLKPITKKVPYGKVQKKYGLLLSFLDWYILVSCVVCLVGGI